MRFATISYRTYEKIYVVFASRTTINMWFSVIKEISDHCDEMNNEITYKILEVDVT